MTCFGTLIAGLAIIPLSIDDEKHTQKGCDIACMASPWLISIGFITCFSALFSKIWRVNKIFHNLNRFRRMKVTERVRYPVDLLLPGIPCLHTAMAFHFNISTSISYMCSTTLFIVTQDVLVPFVVLMTINVIVLLCWTLLAPLTFSRMPSSGTDNWNRVYKSYYGTCTSNTDGCGGALPYVIILVVVNCTAVVIANIQAYQARNIHTEFSESRYIAIATASMLQAFLIGIPVLALVRENPQATFIILSIIIFVTCAAILLLLFLPKIAYMNEYETAGASKRSDSEAETPDESTASTNEGDLKFTILEVRKRINRISLGLKNHISSRRSSAQSSEEGDITSNMERNCAHTRSVRFDVEGASNEEPAVNVSTNEAA